MQKMAFAKHYQVLEEEESTCNCEGQVRNHGGDGWIWTCRDWRESMKEGSLQHQSGEVGKWKVFGGIASCLVWQEHEVTGYKWKSFLSPPPPYLQE